MQRSLVASKNNISLKNIIKFSILDSNTLILCMIGFLLSRAMVVDNIAPLGVAFFICVSTIDKYKNPVFIATIAGTLISFNQSSNIIKYVICLIFIQLISKNIKNIKSINKLSTIGMLIILPLSIGQALIFGNYVYNVSIALVECVLMFISTYIFYYGVSIINKRASRKVT
ncbi:putative membrane protein [[Clostridium] sordellii ATCC 9714]|nr:putative membrane protein [[Clostridium] sordellii ATCC 9714] [Paeniclostridium sordellii ATCC 9714]